MAITALPIVQSYVGNGITKDFPFAFKIDKREDVKLYIDGTEKTYITHFTVNKQTSVLSMIVPPVNNSVVKLERQTEITRTTDYVVGGSLSSDTLDNDFDKNVMILQELNNTILGHNHDLTYSALVHTHNYEPLNANIQSHISNSTLHFTMASISITESQISDFSTYSLDTHNHNASYALLVHNHNSVYSALVHTHLEADITNLDKYTQAEINSLLTGKSPTNHNHNLDYAALVHTHNYEPLNANIQSHISNSTLHFTMASISITESQISNLGTYLTSITSEGFTNLSDVNISNAQQGQLLVFDGTNWTNQWDSFASSGHNHDLVYAPLVHTHNLDISDINSLQAALDLKQNILIKQIDQVSNDLVYKAYAITGSLVSEGKWAITKYEKIGGLWLTKTPNGNTGYSFIWNDRLIYTYS